MIGKELLSTASFYANGEDLGEEDKLTIYENG